MDVIKIQGTDDTPSVILDAASGTFEIAGRSLPEDVSSFYGPILAWLTQFAAEGTGKIVFNFKLSYFNTASSKLILDIMMKLEDMKKAGKDVLIRWNYPDDDEDMQDAGQEYADIVDVDFEQIPYTS
jgi:hypothetical protein